MSACSHAAMLSQLLFCSLYHVRILGQTHIVIENIIQAFLSAAGGCSEMSVCLSLATQLPEMHLFSDIQY